VPGTFYDSRQPRLRAAGGPADASDKADYSGMSTRSRGA
jgi:hypothetical protein